MYEEKLKSFLSHPNTIVIEANEQSKSIESVLPVIEQLIAKKIRRGNILIAIGGGVIQDIACFISSILLRGLEWQFLPTTLLAQADSCIGSKSSINFGSTKNIMGTFNPPSKIWIYPAFLNTLGINEMRSGIGEILKVHAISGRESFNALAKDFDRLIFDRSVLIKNIYCALKIKQEYIEIDEFDLGVRNIFNYGHSFGHAIETATNFAIPHGVAVSMGMDMANHIAVEMGLLSKDNCARMASILRENYKDFAHLHIPIEAMLNALLRDKKNTNTTLILILPVGDEANIERIPVTFDENFRIQCKKFIDEMQA